jgi:hypothetical protein
MSLTSINLANNPSINNEPPKTHLVNRAPQLPFNIDALSSPEGSNLKATNPMRVKLQQDIPMNSGAFTSQNRNSRASRATKIYCQTPKVSKNSLKKFNFKVSTFTPKLSLKKTAKKLVNMDSLKLSSITHAICQPSISESDDIESLFECQGFLPLKSRAFNKAKSKTNSKITHACRRETSLENQETLNSFKREVQPKKIDSVYLPFELESFDSELSANNININSAGSLDVIAAPKHKPGVRDSSRNPVRKFNKQEKFFVLSGSKPKTPLFYSQLNPKAKVYMPKPGFGELASRHTKRMKTLSFKEQLSKMKKLKSFGSSNQGHSELGSPNSKKVFRISSVFSPGGKHGEHFKFKSKKTSKASSKKLICLSKKKVTASLSSPKKYLRTMFNEEGFLNDIDFSPKCLETEALRKKCLSMSTTTDSPTYMKVKPIKTYIKSSTFTKYAANSWRGKKRHVG